jgi:4-hydroxyacetophenone monooxygenase
VSPAASTSTSNELGRLLGLPFDDSDEVIQAAGADASVPALLMSMVHMTGDLSLLDELPKPFLLIAMDLQGAMSEADKDVVRNRAFEVIRDYRDRGCPPPFVPDDEQLRMMFDVISTGQVTEEYVDYVAADLRFTDADQCGPVLVSSPEQRSAFPVVVIGCGEAGLLAGIKLKAAGVPFTIIEKQSAVGGTWLANRYPGCRVDIANQYYAYSFEPTDHWTHYFSEQPEILQYLNDVADRYDIASDVRFNTEVTGAGWHEESATWRVAIRRADGRAETLTARALICAVGQFSNSVIPDIKGSNDFGGPSFHTADWRDDVELTGKRVAVIGAGASGFQLVPAIADLAQQVDVYQRTPQWMAPNPMYHDELNAAWGDSAYAYRGITVPGFPNFFCMFGPGTNAVNGASIIYNSECQMRYIMGCIDMVIAGGFGSATARPDVCDDYNRRSQERLKEMVYTHPAVSSSYYKNASGHVPTLYGFRIFDYWRWTNRPNPDDYELRR